MNVMIGSLKPDSKEEELKKKLEEAMAHLHEVQISHQTETARLQSQIQLLETTNKSLEDDMKEI